MRAILGCVAVLGLSAGLLADDKAAPIDPAKLVGKWEPKVERENRQVVVEFTQDGKLAVRITRKGEVSLAEGTYKVDGNKMALTLKIAGVDNIRTVTVSRLTDGELMGADDKGQEEALVRLKGDK